jgi:hypothetical protein
VVWGGSRRGLRKLGRFAGALAGSVGLKAHQPSQIAVQQRYINLVCARHSSALGNNQSLILGIKIR